MPKQRTHSGAKDRFRVTRSGKVVHKRQNLNHLLEKKTSTRKRRLSASANLSGGQAANVKRMLTGR
jgi:large subunit ribosomal protein L35